VAEILNVPQPTGYLVKTVARGSPAWEAGVQGGDRIAKISGQELPVHGDIVLTVAGIPIGPETFLQIRAHLSSLKSGETFKATLLRAGKIIEISVRIP